MNVDWNGAAVFLGAVGAFAGTMATLVMQVITWRDNRKGKIAAERREAKLDALSKKVSEQ